VAVDVVRAINEAVDVASNRTIEPNVSARDVADVLREELELRNPLRPDDSLNLDFANLLGDDTLGKLFDDSKSLLDESDAFLLADNGLFLNGLHVVLATEVVLTEEVVEVVKTAESTPTIE